MRRLVCAVALGLGMTGAAAAQSDWVTLTGDGIRSALTGKTLSYDDGAIQNFREGGATTYDNGIPSQGNWRIEGDQYCSLWPPSDRWACYAVDQRAGGQDIRFVAGDGGTTTGRYVASP